MSVDRAGGTRRSEDKVGKKLWTLLPHNYRPLVNCKYGLLLIKQSTAKVNKKLFVDLSGFSTSAEPSWVSCARVLVGG